MVMRRERRLSMVRVAMTAGELVHDESGARHVAGVFHERYEGVKDEYLREEHYHSPNAAYHAVGKHCLERAVGQGGAYPLAERANACLNPVHGILPEGESNLEHHVEQEEKNGETGVLVGYYPVDEVRQLVCVLLVAFLKSGLFQCAMYKAVLGIHDGSLRVFLGLFEYPVGFAVAHFDYFLGVGKLGHGLLCGLVCLEELYGEIAGGILVAYVLVFLHLALDGLYASLKQLAVVEVDVAEHAVVGFRTVGEVLRVAKLVLCFVVFVPVLYLGGNFGVYVAVLVDEVYTFVQIDDYVEEQVDTLAGLEHCRHHRNSEKLPQLVVVELVAAFFELVEHIKGANHSQVHVNELRREVEVALQVA